MKFGLRRIILIDSYVEGMASELDVSGHTNISGGNGTGKTSFLRLIPIFYGESPRRLVIASGNGNLSFNEFYLKRSGSYIVFEYMSHGEPRMVVFCNRANDTRHRHVFIESGYREDLFMDVDNGVILPAQGLLTRLNGANISYLNVDTTQNYRQILLDGTVPKAYHFSMCPRNGRMSQLTPLFTGMFKRDAQFSDLSKVIQEYAMDKLDDDSRKILRNFSPHRDHLTTTLIQYDAYQALDKVKPKSETLQAQHEEHRVAKKKLSASVVAARSLSTDLDIKLREHDRNIETAGTLARDEETTYRNERTRLKNLVSSIDEEMGPKESEKNRIERDYASYRKADLPVWEEKLKNIELIISQRDGLKAQHKALSDASEEIRKPIEDEIRQVEKRSDDRVRELESQRDSLIREHHSQRNELTSAHVVEVRKQTSDQQTELTGQISIVSDLAIKVTRLEERLNYPQPSPELAKQLEVAQGNADRSQEEFEKSQNEQGSADDAARKAREQYKGADAKFVNAREHSERTENELLEVQGLINGDEHTFIHFLNERRPGWEDTLGRILQPDILRRKNLSPTIDEEHADARSLFGIDIDFSKLPEQELTPAELAGRHEELIVALEKADQECDEAERDLNKAFTRQNETQRRHEAAQAEFKKAKAQLIGDREMLSQIRWQVEQSARENALRTDEELKQARKDHAQAETALELLQEKHESDVQTLAETHKKALEAIDDEQKDRVESVEKGIKATVKERDSEVERLTRQLEQALSGQGIDPDEMELLGRRTSSLSREIEEIQGKQITIKSYKDFMETDYASLGELKEEITELQATKQKHEDESRDLTNSWNRRSADLQSKIDNLEKAKTRDKNDLNALQVRVLTSSEGRELAVSEHDSTLALYREMAPQSLINEYVKWVQKEAELLQALKRLGDEFAVIFERFPGTPSTQYWQESELDWDGTDERVITRAKAVVDYYRGGKHTIVFESLIKGFGNLDQIEIYRGAMETFNNRIRRFNTELKQHMAKSLTFKSLSDIEPTVAFELDELDYWRDIKSLADGVRAWRDEGGLNSMPGDDLVLQLRSYLDTFEESRANVSVDELWRLIRFRFTLLENGKPKTVTNTKDLSGDASVSSNGLSYLVLIVVFLGFVDMQRRGQPVNLTWALDELRAFDNDNKRALLELLARHGISLVTACPDMEDRELGMFNRVYKLESYKSGLRFVRWTMPPVKSASATNPFLVDETE